MPLRIFSCPRSVTENGVKSTFPNGRDHVVSLIMVENSYVTKSQEVIGTTRFLTWKCSIYVTKYGDIKWGRKEHKGWWLQVSFRVLSVSIADTTVIVPVGRCHPPQLTLFRTLTSHPSDARFCSHELTKLLLSVWRHSEQRVIPNYRIYFSESCHKGTIHFIDTHPLCQYPWYTHL